MLNKRQHKQQPKRLVIWAAKGMFKSARKLADAIKPETDRKVLIVRSDSLRFKPQESDVMINWGNSNYPKFYDYPVNWAMHLNDRECVAVSVNKLKTLRELQGHVYIPEWTTAPLVARLWDTVVIRETLTGFGGKGISLWDKEDTGAEGPIKDAPLYVKYKKKKAEYRVHVFNGKVIDITQKKKRKDFEGEVNTKIRNYANGWVYCREDINVPDDVVEQSVKAVQVLSLDFGAVDTIWNEAESQAYVLEVNSAPGLEGQTIQAYKNAILSTL